METISLQPANEAYSIGSSLRNPCGPRDLKDMSKTPSMGCARHKELLHVDFRSRLNMTFSTVGESTQAAQLPAQKAGSQCFIDLANE